LIVLALLICSQMVPSRPLATVSAQRGGFRAFVLQSDNRPMASFLELFDGEGDRSVHRTLSPFCRDVAVFVCTEELASANMSRRSASFCERVLEECARYAPDSVK
jgi:hypothetical protein